MHNNNLRVLYGWSLILVVFQIIAPVIVDSSSTGMESSSSTGSTPPNTPIPNLHASYRAEQVYFTMGHAGTFLLSIMSYINSHYVYKYTGTSVGRTKTTYQLAGILFAGLGLIASPDAYGIRNIYPYAFPKLVASTHAAGYLSCARLFIFNTVDVQYRFNSLKSPKWIKNVFIIACSIDFICFWTLNSLTFILNQQKFAILSVLYAALVFFVLGTYMTTSVIAVTRAVKRALKNLHKNKTNVSNINGPNSPHAVEPTVTLKRNNYLSPDNDTNTKSLININNDNRNSIKTNVPVSTENESMKRLGKLHKMCLIINTVFVAGGVALFLNAITQFKNGYWTGPAVLPPPDVFNLDTSNLIIIVSSYIFVWWGMSPLFVLIEFKCLHRFQYVQSLISQSTTVPSKLVTIQIVSAVRKVSHNLTANKPSNNKDRNFALP